MGYGEFVEWQAFYSQEPWGDARQDILTAMQMALLANVNRNPKKRRKAFSLADFLPDWWDEKASPRRLEAKLRGIAAKMKGDDSGNQSREPGR